MATTKKYGCETCNFSTDVKCNFIRHNTTQGHLKKIKPTVSGGRGKYRYVF